jgi:parallel beta-helix repeat protein
VRNEYGSIVHVGNLTLADSELYLIDDCDFHQNGSIILKDNATLIIRDSVFNQTADNREFITLTDQARLIIENSSVLTSQAFEVKISVFDQTVLNITASNLTNSYGEIWIWMMGQSQCHFVSSNMSSYGDNSRIVADQDCKAEIRNSGLDFVVCWGKSVADVYGSTVRQGVKAWSTTQVYITDSSINYMWAQHDCRFEVRNTTVYSTVSTEVALRAIDNANIYFFSCMLEDNLNLANSARVRLRNSSVQNISAYNDAIVWLVNSTASGTHTEDQAKIYNFSSIQDAINKAFQGDLVLIPSGTYYEHVVVNKTISLIGEDEKATFIVGEGAGTVVLVVANGSLISGFSVQNGVYGVSVDSVDNCTVTNNRITNNTDGITLSFAENCTVTFNEVNGNDLGLSLYASYGCVVKRNSFRYNGLAIRFNVSDLNVVHHNNLIDNVNQTSASDSFYNALDDGAEGNYWSSYAGVDLNYDGIGDSPQVVDGSNEDNRPLMGIFHSFNTSSGYPVDVITNSTIEDFEYFSPNGTIRMHIFNATALPSVGFCRVAIPHALFNVSNISVVIDGGLVPVLFPNYSLYDDGAHRWIYFAYEQSDHEVDIVSEFPSIAITIPFITLTLVVVILGKKKPYIFC